MLDDVVILKFKGSRREFYQNYLDLPFGIGDYAVVETADGENMGVITQEWAALKLDESKSKFSDISVN